MLMTKTQSEFLRKRAPLRREEETPDDEPVGGTSLPASHVKEKAVHVD
jgi:hypothetical protein